MINKGDKESGDFFFHFTPELRHLVNIMINKFMPFYCMESLEYLNFPELQFKAVAYPMICFSDIPVSRQKAHQLKFGAYGIGLTKDWGIKNMLSPVLYSHKKSMTSLSIKMLFDLSVKLNSVLNQEEFHKYNIAASILIYHFKPVNGYQYSKKEHRFVNEQTCFRDEKEWRYYPLNNDKLLFSLTLEQYKDDNIRESNNLKIQENNHLLFKLADIEYLFLKEVSDKELFLNAISETFSKEELKIIENKIQYN